MLPMLPMLLPAAFVGIDPRGPSSGPEGPCYRHPRRRVLHGGDRRPAVFGCCTRVRKGKAAKPSGSSCLLIP